MAARATLSSTYSARKPLTARNKCPDKYGRSASFFAGLKTMMTSIRSAARVQLSITKSSMSMIGQQQAAREEIGEPSDHCGYEICDSGNSLRGIVIDNPIQCRQPHCLATILKPADIPVVP